MQRPSIFPRSNFLLRSVSLLHGQIGRKHCISIQLRSNRAAALQVIFRELHRRKLLQADAPRKLGHRQIQNIITECGHCSSPLQ